MGKPNNPFTSMKSGKGMKSSPKPGSRSFNHGSQPENSEAVPPDEKTVRTRRISTSIHQEQSRKLETIHLRMKLDSGRSVKQSEVVERAIDLLAEQMGIE